MTPEPRPGGDRPRPLTDRFLRWFGRLTLDAFYRRIEVVGVERFPMDRPVIVLANHSNSLVDGAVITSFLPRMPRFLGASTVWDYRPLRPILNAAGVVPLYRRQDGRADRGKLADSFASACKLLEAGGVLAIFPEGISHNNPRVLPLKSGAARIALETETRHGPTRLTIVPVCLTFEAKYRVRSRALLEIGDPVDLACEDVEAFGSESLKGQAAAVKALTGRLHDRLDAMTPGHESWEEARLVARAAEMIGNADPDPTGAGLYSIAEIRRGIHDGYLWVQQTQPERTEELRRQIAEYDRALRSSGLRDDQIAHGVTAGGAFATGRKRTALKTVLLTPVALLGLALNLLPFFVLRMLSRRKDLDKRSTWSIFAGFFVFPFFWLVTALAIGLVAAAYGDAATGWICGGATILLALATGRPTLTFLDNAAAIWAETRARVLLRGNSRRAIELTTQRSRIRAELAALSDEYAAFCEQAEG
ncbi:lysophospholipid acyltransferase family protein [Nioella sp.]|uniref:lysophospholipid acyltransferase family protein n=1 Tax=Nioella sp. TaxID=1912091 RepID=UPI003A8646DE